MNAATLFLVGISLAGGAVTAEAPAPPIVVPPGATVTVDPAPAAATPVPRRSATCRTAAPACKNARAHRAMKHRRHR